MPHFHLSHRRAVPLVLMGALLGSAVRIGLADALPDWRFPVATLIVNLVGAFLVGLYAARLHDRPEVFTFAIVGIGGAATTFSALTLQAVTLTEDGHFGIAALYVAVSLGVGFVAALVGIRAGATS